MVGLIQLKFRKSYGVELISELQEGAYDAIVLAVDHSEFKNWGEDKVRALGKEKHVLYDVKYVLEKSAADIRL